MYIKLNPRTKKAINVYIDFFTPKSFGKDVSTPVKAGINNLKIMRGLTPLHAHNQPSTNVNKHQRKLPI